MKVEKRDGTRERRILTAMIVDRVTLARVSSQWPKEGLFRNRWANIIGGWAVRHLRKYDRAPGRSIQSRFETWAQDNKDKETVAIVERFLEGLSEDYANQKRDVSSDVAIDEAAEHFERVRLEKLKEELDGDLEEGNLAKANERLAKTNPIEMGFSGTIDILQDKEAIREAFESRGEPLFKYPGALGNFINEAFERDGFLAITGPEKRGKTFWLLDIAWTAMLCGRKVAFFEVGDMSQNQIMRRFMTRASRRPLNATQGNKNERYNKPVRVPTFIESPTTESEFAQVDFKEYEWERPLSWQKAWKACQQVVTRTNSQEPLLKLCVRPNRSMTVTGMESVIAGWKHQGWTPDVIVTDYADILAPLNGSADTRDQINETWMALRRLSQVHHSLVVTATQTDAASYDVKTLGRKNFSEDKRKHAHVTAMIGLNQTEEEKVMGVMRLNWLDLREGEFLVSKCVHVAGCPALANMAMKSTF